MWLFVFFAGQKSKTDNVTGEELQEHVTDAEKVVVQYYRVDPYFQQWKDRKRGVAVITGGNVQLSTIKLKKDWALQHSTGKRCQSTGK